MGRSLKWRVATPGGERLLRVQAAMHGRRVRLFVDEVLVEQYDAFHDLRDNVDVHDFDVGGTACQLTISAYRAKLLADGVEIPQVPPPEV